MNGTVTKMKMHNLIFFIPVFFFCQVILAEEAKLTPLQETIAETVIRYHFVGPGHNNTLMARIGIFGKDPSDAFLQKFSNYSGFFGKFKDTQVSIDHDNYALFNITVIRIIDRNNARALAAENLFEYIYTLKRQPDDSWVVDSGYILERSYVDS